MVADASSGRVLLEDGDCRTRVTPASTFKIPLAVMGFDDGFLIDAHAPVLTFRPGDPDWGGAAWRRPTDPTAWLKYSVVWYSQRVTHHLGAAEVSREASRFGFGNADMSGDTGRGNGLDRAWIMSSLKVSPAEQVEFLRKLVTRQLPVSPHAIDATLSVVETSPTDGGWMAHGKTGTAFPHRPNGGFDQSRGYGWYVGWMSKAGCTMTFARLDQDDAPHPETPGLRARAAFIGGWDALVATLPQ